MSAGIFGCHMGWGSCYWHLVESRAAAEHPTVRRAAPQQKVSQSQMLRNPALETVVAILKTTVLALQKAESHCF